MAKRRPTNRTELADMSIDARAEALCADPARVRELPAEMRSLALCDALAHARRTGQDEARILEHAPTTTGRT